MITKTFNKKSISLDEELELIKKSQNGDDKAFEKLYIENYGLIIYMAKSFSNFQMRSPVLHSFDDMIAIATVAFVNSVNKFSADFGCKFSTFYYAMAKNDFFNEYNSKIVGRELELSLNFPVDLGDGDSIEYGDTLPSETAKRDFDVCDQEMDTGLLLSKIEGFLSEKEYMIFKNVILGEKTMSSIAKELNVSRQLISLKFKNILRKVRKNISIYNDKNKRNKISLNNID